MKPARNPKTYHHGSLIVLRDLCPGDVSVVNQVLAAAIQTWGIAPRVKRLALTSYHYKDDDFQHLAFVGTLQDEKLLGFASLEPVDLRGTIGTDKAMLLHGIYVVPEMHRLGLGTRLINAAKKIARNRGFGGLLVRAEKNAATFFEKQGFAPLPVNDSQRDYPHRLLAPIATH